MDADFQTDFVDGDYIIIECYRAIDPAQTNPVASDFLLPSAPVYTFTDPVTGAKVQAQNNRAGIDYGDFDGRQNAAASLDGFNFTSQASMDAYNQCVFAGDINGSDVCAGTNGLNREEFEGDTTQLNVSYQLTDNIELKYVFGFNETGERFHIQLKLSMRAMLFLKDDYPATADFLTEQKDGSWLLSVEVNSMEPVERIVRGMPGEVERN